MLTPLQDNHRAFTREGTSGTGIRRVYNPCNVHFHAANRESVCDTRVSLLLIACKPLNRTPVLRAAGLGGSKHARLLCVHDHGRCSSLNVVGSRAAGRRHLVLTIAAISCCIAASLLTGGVVSAAFADETIAWIENRITLLDAVTRGYVTAEFTATGSIGVAIDMSITSTMNITLAVTIEPGLRFESDLPGVQRFVVRSPVEFHIATNMETSRFIELAPEETLAVELEAYCLDASERLPEQGARYHILGMASAPVERVLRGSIQEAEHPGACALQAAVWIAQENLTKAQFDARLGSRCLSADAARAVELCDQAQITPDASWLAQIVASTPGSGQQADLEPDVGTPPDTDAEPDAASITEKPSSSAAEWLLLGGLISFAVILVKLLEGF